MNDFVGRSRADALRSLPLNTRSDTNSVKLGKLDGGKSIQWSGVSPNSKLSFKTLSSGGGEGVIKLTSLGQEDFAGRADLVAHVHPQDERYGRLQAGPRVQQKHADDRQGSGTERGQSRITRTQDAVVDMMGLDPTRMMNWGDDLFSDNAQGEHGGGGGPAE